MDFTLKIYRELLVALQHKGYSFYTFEECCEGKAAGKFVILRHDIDKNPSNALRFAQLEAEFGIRSTFFFLIKKEVFKPIIIRQIASLGHEIGYHYRDLVDAGGNKENALLSFEANLSRLRAIVPINTICMDGCPWSKYDNRNIWKINNYKDYGIIGEPYFDVDFNKVFYLTDTGRMWDGERYSVRDKVETRHAMSVQETRHATSVQETRHATSVQDSGKLIVGSGKNKLQTTPDSYRDYNLNTSFHSTNDIIRSVQSGTLPSQIMITTHPQRWTDNKVEWIQELIMQRVKNVVKKFIVGRL